MTDIPVPGEDHGLGPEVIDQSTAVAGTTVDPVLLARVNASHGKGRLHWFLATAAVVLLVEQATFGALLYTPILGDLAVKYHTANVVWVITAFLLASAVALPVFSKLGDLYGKKRVLGVVLVLASAGTLLSAVAPSFPVLIAGRALMGTTTVYYSLCLAMVREIFPPRLRALAIAMAVNGAGFLTVGGPLLTGWLVNVWSVDAPFYFQLGLGLLAGVMAMVLLPESPSRLPGRVDYVGALLLSGGLFGVTIGLSQVQAMGWGGFTIGWTAGGAAALAAWVFQLRHSKDPIINLALLRRRVTATPVVVMALVVGVVGALQVLVVLQWSSPHQIVAYGHGLSPFRIALWGIPTGVVTVAVGAGVGLTARSVGYRAHMIVGAAGVTAVAVLLAVTLQAPPAVLITVYAFAAIGSGVLPAGVSLLMLAVPPDQRGIAIGVSSAVGAVVASSVVQVVYAVLRTSVTAQVAGVPYYAAGSFRVAYLTVAGLAAAALVLALLIKNGRRLTRAPRPESVASARAADR